MKQILVNMLTQVQVIAAQYSRVTGRDLSEEEMAVFADWVYDRPQRLLKAAKLVKHLPFAEVAKEQERLVGQGSTASDALLDAIHVVSFSSDPPKDSPMCPPG